MNPGTERELKRLRFSGDTEREFRQEYYRRSLGPVRCACLLALCLIALYRLAELCLEPTLRLRQWLLRYGVVCPALLAVMLFSVTPAFARFGQAAIGAVLLVVGLGTIGAHLGMPLAE